MVTIIALPVRRRWSSSQPAVLQAARAGRARLPPRLTVALLSHVDGDEANPASGVRLFDPGQPLLLARCTEATVGRRAADHRGLRKPPAPLRLALGPGPLEFVQKRLGLRGQGVSGLAHRERLDVRAPHALVRGSASL